MDLWTTLRQLHAFTNLESRVAKRNVSPSHENNIEAMVDPMVSSIAKYMCQSIFCSCLCCFLKADRHHWFWRENRVGQIRVEFLNLFRELERIEGVSFDALERENPFRGHFFLHSFDISKNITQP